MRNASPPLGGLFLHQLASGDRERLLRVPLATKTRVAEVGVDTEILFDYARPEEVSMKAYFGVVAHRMKGYPVLL